MSCKDDDLTTTFTDKNSFRNGIKKYFGEFSSKYFNAFISDFYKIFACKPTNEELLIKDCPSKKFVNQNDRDKNCILCKIGKMKEGNTYQNMEESKDQKFNDIFKCLLNYIANNYQDAMNLFN